VENRYLTGFALFLQHRGVVYGALARMAVPRSDNNYDDLVHDGMLLYVDYYVKYREPLSTPEAVLKFNRLAGYFIYKTLISRAKDLHRRQQIAFTVDTDSLAKNEPDSAFLASDRLQTNNLITLLYTALTPIERQVLLLRFFDQLKDIEIANQLAISHQRVGRIRKQIIIKYQALLTQQLT